jgi:hypothetical protein
MIINKIFIVRHLLRIVAKEFSLNHLSDSEFEEFCFELLKELGFKNINWRKGTGKKTSPSDNGRDIECETFIKDIDKKIYKEKWFFECKHYLKGVPPEKIQGALSWANAERPDKLVIIASNFLSNPCKNHLDDFIENNKPPFRIKYWELKDLEDLTFGKLRLLKKYKLSDGLDFLEIMHPAHIRYISKPTVNTLDYFFSIMDDFDSTKRDEIVANTSVSFINPRCKKPITGKEKMGELRVDDVDYKALKEKCHTLSLDLSDEFIVKSVTSSILEWLFHYADKTSTEIFIRKNKDLIEFLQNKLETDVDKNEIEICLKLIKEIDAKIEGLPKQTEHFHSLYTDFCIEILPKLMEEDILWNQSKQNLRPHQVMMTELLFEIKGSSDICWICGDEDNLFSIKTKSEDGKIIDGIQCGDCIEIQKGMGAVFVEQIPINN